MSFSEQFRQLIEDPASASCLVKWSFIFVLIFSLLGSAYQWLILDDLAKLKQLHTQEIQLKQTFKDKHHFAYLLPFYRVQLQEIRKIFGEIIQTLPKQTEVAGLILDISEIAVNNGLRIQAFEPKAEVLQKFYAEKHIYLKATGTYKQLATFASDLAVLPRIVSLHNIELEPLEQKQTKKDAQNHTVFNTMLEMQAIVKTFRYLATETAPQ